MTARPYKVLIFPRAERDLEEIIDYLYGESPATAEGFLRRFLDGLTRIEKNPKIHPLVRDERLAAKGYRIVALKNYLAFYVIAGRSVQVRRVLFGRRRYADFL